MPHRPSDHPTIPPEKIGVLIANLGTPDGTDYRSMRRYLSEFLSDQRVVDLPRWKWQPLLQLVILSKRPFTSGRLYDKIWNHARNEGPLITTTRAQAQKLSARLTRQFGDKVIVDFCMRYGNPSTESRLKSLIAQGCRKILFFPLYPQYAGASTATANDRFFQALAGEKWQPAVRTVPAYYDHPSYIKALAQSVRDAYAKPAQVPDMLLASYHGMPKRYLLEGDPYYCQCLKTSGLLKAALGFDDSAFVTSFQSKFGRDEWLTPATVDEVRRLAQTGTRHLAVISPAFSADCLETLEEIREEIRECFLSAGGESFTYVPCLNDSAAHIAMLAEIVAANLSGWA